MYNTFTKKERSEIEKTFGHWDDEKNAEWVLNDIDERRHLNDSFVNNRINELVECGLIKSHSEKIYVYIKLEEFWKVLKVCFSNLSHPQVNKGQEVWSRLVLK